MRDVALELPIESMRGEPVDDVRRPSQLSPQRTIEIQENLEQLRKFLAALPPDYRLAIELRSLKRQSFAELGKKLNRTAEAARKIWVRAIERLQAELERGIP